MYNDMMWLPIPTDGRPCTVTGPRMNKLRNQESLQCLVLRKRAIAPAIATSNVVNRTTTR
jgi:hypothetical protein